LKSFFLKGVFYCFFSQKMVYFLISGVFMFRRSIICFVLMCTVCFAGFGQAAAIRDYVGMISQVFHPDIVAFLERLRGDLVKRNRTAAVRSLDRYLKGESGTGFVYVAPDGKNYIITNYHVISQADTLTVTFEKPDGERTRFSGLTIVAADKDMDIALLAFAGGQNPFRQGMAFINRAVEEGDDVYSAGFPDLGGVAMVWQLGRGIVSNSSVRIPNPDDATDVFGPFIQHTAQIDPGNSGGPLLIQTPGVPSGYAVAGINTLVVRFRQAANFSIPMNRVQTFLDTTFQAPVEDELTRVNAGIDTFIQGLGAPKAVYPHIADFLSYACTGENVDYALSEVFDKAPRTVQDDIFDRDVVDAMIFAVAWLIENNLRTKTGTMPAMTKESVTPSGDGRYKVTFNVSGKTMDSEWVNEYGNWRIRKIGDFASGDKTMVEKKKKATTTAANLRADPHFQIAAGYTNIIDRGAAVGLDLIVRGDYVGGGLNAYFGKDFFQIESGFGVYIPIKANVVAFTPFAQVGAGVQFKKVGEERTFGLPDFGFSLKGGLQFTTAAVPGLFLQGAYQYNLYLFSTLAADSGNIDPDKHLITISLGYSF
jgi:serine protease Do